MTVAQGQALRQVIDEALMDFATYAAIRERIRPPVLLHRPVGQGHLLLLGVAHSHDPSDPALSAVARHFLRFQPHIAYAEGGRPQLLGDARSTIGAHGEAGLLALLAHRAAIPLRTVEPWRIDEAAALWRHHPREMVKLFYVLRDLDTWHRGHRAVPIAHHAKVLLDNLVRVGITGQPRLVRDLAACTRAWLPEHPWQEVPSACFNPVQDHGWTNEIARRSSILRDAHAVYTLHRAASRGARVFAVLGFTHVVMQRPAWDRLS